jgi:uncharacterized membrane protein
MPTPHGPGTEPNGQGDSGGTLDDGASRILTHVVYGLQAAFLINGVSLILGVVLNYAKRKEMGGTLYESHFRHQIGTFWVAVGGLVLVLFVGAVTILPRMWRGPGTEFPIGAEEVILLGGIPVALTIYLYYRILRGWLTLLEDRPIR